MCVDGPASYPCAQVWLPSPRVLQRPATVWSSNAMHAPTITQVWHSWQHPVAHYTVTFNNSVVFLPELKHKTCGALMEAAATAPVCCSHITAGNEALACGLPPVLCDDLRADVLIAAGGEYKIWKITEYLKPTASTHPADRACTLQESGCMMRLYAACDDNCRVYDAAYMDDNCCMDGAVACGSRRRSACTVCQRVVRKP